MLKRLASKGFLIIPLFFIKADESHARSFYFGAEVPIHTKLANSKYQSKNSNKVNTQSFLSHSKNIFPSELAFVIGHRISSYWEVNLAIGGLSSLYQTNECHMKKSKINDIPIDYYSVATYNRDLNEIQACTKQECIVTSQYIYNLYNRNNHSINITNHLKYFIISAHLKPFKEIKLFTPYFSSGIGMSFSKSKIKEFPINNFPEITKSKNYAYELGIGSTVAITKKVNFDLNVKYFNHGKHELNKNIIKKISGIKLSTGIILTF